MVLGSSLMVIYQMLRKAPVLRVWRVFFVARLRAGQARGEGCGDASR